MEKYMVYTHTFPDGKVFVGYLNLAGDYAGGRTIDEIWNNGEYHKGKRLHDDIQAAGWDNIKHEIVYSELTREQAVEKKKELCIKYKSYLPEYGCNKPIDVGIKKSAAPKSSARSNPKSNVNRNMNKMIVISRIEEFIIEEFFDEDENYDVHEIQSQVEYLLLSRSIERCRSMRRYLAARRNHMKDLMADKCFDCARSKVRYIVEVAINNSKYF